MKYRILSVIVSIALLSITACSTNNSDNAIDESAVYSAEEELAESSPSSETGQIVSENTGSVDYNPFNEDAIVSEFTTIARECEDIYRSIEYYTQTNGVTFVPTDDEITQILNRIGDLGYPAYRNGMDMLNAQNIRDFYSAYESGDTAECCVYTFNSELTRVCFYTEDGNVYVTNITLSWDENFEPIVSGITYVNLMEKFEITEKGWLFYGQDKEPTSHFAYISGMRVEPLGEEKRAFYEKYLKPLMSFVTHNVLIDSWDEGSISDVSFNDVFEVLYEYETGNSASSVYTELYSSDDSNVYAVPAEDFESIITKYFDLTSQQLRKCAVYDSEHQVYAMEYFLNGDYPPELEIVDFTYNSDGTLTLFIEAVNIEYGKDNVATLQLTVKTYSDGSFHYISNIVEHKEENSGVRPLFPSYYPRVEKEYTE